MGDGIGQGERGEACAAAQGRITDPGDSFREVELDEVLAVVEGRVVDDGDALGDVEHGRGRCGGVGDQPGHVLGVKHPVNGLEMGIHAAAHVAGGIVAATKGAAIQHCHIAGNVETGDAVATVKSKQADLDQRIGEIQETELSAVVEGIVANLGDALGNIDQRQFSTVAECLLADAGDLVTRAVVADGGGNVNLAGVLAGV